MNLNSENHLDFIKNYLPKYLTPDLKDNLFNVVKSDFPNSNNPNILYINLKNDNLLYQGDCIIDVPFSIFDKNENKFESLYQCGVILSNTCDISPENLRIGENMIQFAATCELNEYIEELKKNRISEDRVKNFIIDLKSNKISNLFYLPKKEIGNKVVMEESFIKFDSTVSLPINLFINDEVYNMKYSPEGDRTYTFSNYGFYLFIIKLSIHYCRFREGVFRNE